MPKRRDVALIDVTVGFFLTFSVALFFGMLITYGKIERIWRGRQELTVVFESASGIRPDAPVRYNGLDVGRVKSIRAFHLDDENLQRLPTLTKRDIESLPLKAADRIRLKAALDADFDPLCRRALKGGTMIEVVLEVLQEGDFKRYRLDDQIRIATTVFNESSVEIVSGRGAVPHTNETPLILGSSGDFVGNVAKSMDDVKAILASVTNVVGERERQSFTAAQERGKTIGERLDNMSVFARSRAEKTAERLGNLGLEIPDELDRIKDSFDLIPPRVTVTSDAGKTVLKDLRIQSEAVQKEGQAAITELSTEVRAIRADLEETIAKSRPELNDTRVRMRAVFDTFNAASTRIDNMLTTARLMLANSQPDLARFRTAIAASFLNFRDVGEAAKMNKDLLLGNRDAGEYEYNTALDIYRRISMAQRRITDAAGELQESQRDLEKQLPDTPEILRVKATLTRVLAAREPFDAMLKSMDPKMLPPFERKGSTWFPSPPRGEGRREP